jgi:hypothetical protein
LRYHETRPRLHLNEVIIMPVTQHDIDTLRLVGRLGVASGRALHPLICPEAHVATRNRRLQRLVDSGLLWRDSTPHPNRDTIGRPLGRSLAVYGLTRRGRKILDIQGVIRIDLRAADRPA